MDVPNQISKRIVKLRSGETWTVSIQDLLISRADFHSLSVFLNHESKNGTFSVGDTRKAKSHFGLTSLTIVKN